MTTKEFIKMLQEADPNGNAHIRMSGGVPIYAEHKEGYWDGPYSYIEDGKWVYSVMGSKVDIASYDIYDFIEDNYSLHDNTRNNWESIKNLFVFKLGCYSIKSQQHDREESVLKSAKKDFDDIDEMHKRHFNKSKDEMIENSDKGWTWFQNKEVDSEKRPNLHMHYTWKIYDENGKDQGSNIHQTESIIYSGLWERIDNGAKEGYYQWIKTNK